MDNIKILNIYYFLISIIPLSIIAGPSISLVIILLISIIFLINLRYLKGNFQKKNVLYLFLVLYLYLIFNSFISIDYKEGIFRNLGFIRFIILFIAINLFFYISEDDYKFLNIWTIIIFQSICNTLV